MLQTTTPDLAANLATEISRFRGNVYRYLIALLRDPDVPDAVIARSLGLASDTPAAWLALHPGFREVRQRIRDSRDSMRTEYAHAAIAAAVPDAVDALIAVATDPKARDGQRARERILEETGVLQRQGQPADDGTARATLALLVGALQAAQGRQRQPETQRTVIDVPEIGNTT